MTPTLAATIVRESLRREACAAATLEDVVTRREFAALPASALQRAITRAADGLPLGDVEALVDVDGRFGCSAGRIGLAAPVLVVLVCGVRSGKSFLSACAAIKGCLTADLSKLQDHEVPRYAIVAPTVDNAQATFRILTGIVQSSPYLAPCIEKQTSERLMLRRPDGRIVEIMVVAAHRGGIAMRSRWLIGFVLEEVALFGEQAVGAAVTGEELLRAGEARLLPGSQGWIISSPFGETGFLWDLYNAHFGSPGRYLVVHAPSRDMNPTIVTKEMVDAIAANDPDAAAREYGAQWLSASTSMISGGQYDRCARLTEDDVPWQPGFEYVAAMDAATRGNAWTLVILTRRREADGSVKDVVVCNRQWVGSKAKPLDPLETLREIAKVLAEYKLRGVWADEYGSDFVRRLGNEAGISVVLVGLSSADKVELYKGLELQVAHGSIELPADKVFRRDLLGIKKVARQGSVQIVLPVTQDGRHGDYAPSLILTLKRKPGEPAKIEAAKTPNEFAVAHLEQLLAQRAAQKSSNRLGGHVRVDGARGREMPRFGR